MLSAAAFMTPTGDVGAYKRAKKRKQTMTHLVFYRTVPQTETRGVSTRRSEVEEIHRVNTKT